MPNKVLEKQSYGQLFQQVLYFVLVIEAGFGPESELTRKVDFLKSLSYPYREMSVLVLKRTFMMKILFIAWE